MAKRRANRTPAATESPAQPESLQLNALADVVRPAAGAPGPVVIADRENAEAITEMVKEREAATVSEPARRPRSNRFRVVGPGSVWSPDGRHVLPGGELNLSEADAAAFGATVKHVED